MSRLLLLAPFLIVGGGCSGSEDKGTRPTVGTKPSAERLAEMPPEARRGAEAAAGQASERMSDMDRATREMKKMQSGGNR